MVQVRGFPACQNGKGKAKSCWVLSCTHSLFAGVPPSQKTPRGDAATRQCCAGLLRKGTVELEASVVHGHAALRVGITSVKGLQASQTKCFTGSSECRRPIPERCFACAVTRRPLRHRTLRDRLESYTTTKHILLPGTATNCHVKRQSTLRYPLRCSNPANPCEPHPTTADSQSGSLPRYLVLYAVRIRTQMAPPDLDKQPPRLPPPSARRYGPRGISYPG